MIHRISEAILLLRPGYSESSDRDGPPGCYIIDRIRDDHDIVLHRGISYAKSYTISYIHDIPYNLNIVYMLHPSANCVMTQISA